MIQFPLLYDLNRASQPFYVTNFRDDTQRNMSART